jgi:hypothetical protein
MVATTFGVRVWEKVTVTGTGAVTLSGTVQLGGYATFASQVPVGAQLPYYIADASASAWEAGMGVFSGAAPGGFTRVPFASSNGGALVSFLGNLCDVVSNLLPPVTANNGAGPTGMVLATSPDGFLDESFSRFPAINLKPRNQLQTLIAGKIMINSQVNAPVRFKVGVIGDSTGMGYGGLPGNYLQHSITAYISQALVAAGYRSTYDSNYGTGNENNTDARLVMTGATNAPFNAAAGGAYQLSAAGTLSFSPLNPWDTVDILSYNQAGIGPMTVTSGSITTPLGTLNQTQVGPNPTIQTFSTGAAPAIQTLTIGWTSGSIDVLGISCYNSKAPAIEVYNFCGGSQPTSTYASTSPAYGALNTLIQTGVQVVFYELGINDGIQGVTAATFGANVLLAVNALQAAGIEVILMMPPIIPGATYSTTLFPGYLQQLQAISIANNVPLVNWMDVYGNGLALGLDAGQPHPDNAVYQDKANYLVRNIFQAQPLTNLIPFLRQATQIDPPIDQLGAAQSYVALNAGRQQLRTIDGVGKANFLQAAIPGINMGLWSAPGNGTTVPGIVGIGPPVTAGTATARSVATTNYAARLRRLGNVSAATAGALAYQYMPAAQFSAGSGALGDGSGFFALFRFVPSDAAAVSGERFFVGMTSAVVAPTNVEPSSLIQSVGVAQISTDATQLYLVYGGTTAQTAIALGTAFPCAGLSTAAFDLAIYAPNGVANTFYVQVTNLVTGAVFNKTLTGAAAVVPQSTTLLAPCIWKTNNATALAVAYDLATMYFESGS